MALLECHGASLWPGGDGDAASDDEHDAMGGCGRFPGSARTDEHAEIPEGARWAAAAASQDVGTSAPDPPGPQ